MINVKIIIDWVGHMAIVYGVYIARWGIQTSNHADDI